MCCNNNIFKSWPECGSGQRTCWMASKKRNQGTTLLSCYHLQLGSDPELQERVHSLTGWDERVHGQSYSGRLSYWTRLEAVLVSCTLTCGKPQHFHIGMNQPTKIKVLSQEAQWPLKGHWVEIQEIPKSQPLTTTTKTVCESCSSPKHLGPWHFFTCKMRCLISKFPIMLSCQYPQSSAVVSATSSRRSKNPQCQDALVPPGLQGVQKHLWSNKTSCSPFLQTTFCKGFYHEILHCQ